MKKIVVILDGLGDLGCSQFNGKTPLEVAETPNLNELAKKGRLGYVNVVGENITPQSDSAVLALLGNDVMISSRGQFEAIGLNVKLKRGDLALRANFGTVEDIKTRKIKDRRAGRTLTTKEARQLAKSINKEVKLPVKFEFIPGIQHRGVLILRGGFSDNITDTDMHYANIDIGSKIKEDFFSWSKALDEEENSEFSANIVNSFIDQAYKVLKEHPVNKIRIQRGLMPANIILTRGGGIETPVLKKYEKAMAIVNMPLEKGIAKLSGMDVFSLNYPNMKHYDVYENLYNGLNKMIKFIIRTFWWRARWYNFCYIHIKETDVPGHDNKPLEKKQFIEILDRDLFGFLRRYAEKNKVKLLITADHSTPCRLKDHSSDPVPVLLFDPEQPGDRIEKFSEKESKNGSLGKIKGKNLLKKVGFD